VVSRSGKKMLEKMPEISNVTSNPDLKYLTLHKDRIRNRANEILLKTLDKTSRKTKVTMNSFRDAVNAMQQV